MELTIEKVIHIPAERARQLELLALTRGVTAEALVVEALEAWPKSRPLSEKSPKE